MNKIFWLLTPFVFTMAQSSFAATANCNFPTPVSVARATGTINNFSYSETITNQNYVRGLLACSGPVAVRSDFIASSGNTNLTATGGGAFPFGVDTNVIVSGSSANATDLNAAKAWLASNLKLSFNIKDNNNIVAAVNVTALNTNYNVHPNTTNGQLVTINGESYFRSSVGVLNADIRFPNIGIQFINNTKPSASIINALNGTTVKIRLGRINFKYDDYNGVLPPSGNPKQNFDDYDLDLKLNFSFPTCTMANQTVTLAPVPTGILNSNQTANEQPFNVNINCTTTMPNKILLATITDSYTPSNINNNGILKNQPALANRSNVDVQLRDTTDTPLAIGTQSSFYSVPAGSTATTFIKALKARYYRSAATATAGYVQTQATVSLDYQ
jgi:hypothetical protein